MNILHIGINIQDNTIHLGEWSNQWIEGDKTNCLNEISHNFILNGIEYPINIANYVDILTLDPCISYDGVFHVDSPNTELTIKLFLIRLYKHIGIPNHPITFYYYSTLIGDVDDIIKNLQYRGNGWYCNIM